MREVNTTVDVLLYLENNMLKAIYFDPVTTGQPMWGLA
jgi:hypothetical protein